MLYLDDDTDNENIVMLPDEMFVNLIDMDLQNQIAIANDIDSDAAEALKLLLEKAPTEMTTGLEDWKLETTEGRNILFYKGKNYIPKDIEPVLYTPPPVRSDSLDSDRIPSSPSSVRSESELSPSSVWSESELSPSSVRSESKLSPSSVRSESDQNPSSVWAQSQWMQVQNN